MTKATGKRKGKSMKNKNSWRKHTDLADVEDFLDDQRLEERLGGSFNEREDKDIFVVDKTPESVSKSKPLNKKIRAKIPPNCLRILQSWTSVPDPISKRNRVKTKEERKCAIRKRVEELKRKNGFVKKKDIAVKNDRKLTKKAKLNAPKPGEFKVDIWEETKENPLGDATWLEEETSRHVLRGIGKQKIRHPKSFFKNSSKAKTSDLMAVEPPHPGTSYNPSFEDHQQLLREIAEKEMKIIKEEKHLTRVTSGMFSKVTAEENHTQWMSEMSAGLNEPVGPEDKNEGDYKAINRPTSFSKKKTLQTRRKQREAKKEAHERTKLRVEKKKIADIHKLKILAEHIKRKEQKLASVKEKRDKKKAAEGNRTKRLGKRKYKEPDIEFQQPHQIAGSLRALDPEGSILGDRFYSMQKRNMLEVTTKQLKTHKTKMKKFFKPGHKIEDPPILKKKKK